MAEACCRIAPQRAEEAQRRLKAIEGQIKGIQGMIQEDRYCVEILMQVSAVQEALTQVSKIIMRNYLENCVTDSIRSDNPETVYDELMEIIYKYRR